MEIKRYAIYWVDLNPTKGSEINKVRPAVVISPDELNAHLNTVIVAPVTSSLKAYPWRVGCMVGDHKSMIATDQIRSIDKLRIGQYAGELSKEETTALKDALEELLIL